MKMNTFTLVVLPPPTLRSAMFVTCWKLQRSADQSVRHKTHPADKNTFCSCF